MIETPEAIVEAGLQDRCQCVAADCFEAAPKGGDVYMLKRILHDWSDVEAIRILSCIRNAMKPDTRIAVIGLFSNRATSLTPTVISMWES